MICHQLYINNTAGIKSTLLARIAQWVAHHTGLVDGVIEHLQNDVLVNMV